MEVWLFDSESQRTPRCPQRYALAGRCTGAASPSGPLWYVLSCGLSGSFRADIHLQGP